MKLVKSLIGSTFMYLITICFAEASLIVEDSAFGVETITVDTQSGLSWLDIDLTTGFSYDDILLETQTPGGVFLGFRLASPQEVAELWTNAGITLSEFAPLPANVSPVFSLLTSYIGSTSIQTGNPEAIGITSELLPGPAVTRGSLDFSDGIAPGYLASFSTTSGSSARFDSIGAWLVQDTPTSVPAPATFLLVFVMLFRLRKRSR